jgi:hypothetical protein
MNAELSFKTAVCNEYEKLLVMSQKALEVWRNRRQEFTTFRLSRKKVADGLLRSQTH